MSTQPQTCRCSLHTQIEQLQMEARRHASYRQLANTILGATAPRTDSQLAHALAEHARVVRAASKISHFPERRAA